MTTDGRRAIIIPATPTSNGDLHVGHMAGPYLASDVYARYLRATGRPVIYTTVTDDSQSYVVTVAQRQGTTPQALCTSATAQIERTMRAMGLSIVGLPPIDDRYRRTVLEFMTALHAAGRFRTKTVRLPYAQLAGRYLYDALVTGTCPVCLGGSCGGACEGCGHPNNYDQLLDARSTLDPSDPVVYREHTILVLPMEEHRDRLTAYYATKRGRWRPHAMQLIGELLAGPLPEVPVTVPGTWGIHAPFPETPGQVFYPWVEAMPASIYGTWWAARQQGELADAVDEFWLAEHGAEIVYFHGYDNVYHWALMDLVFLMAHGDRYVTPESNVCNEFYDLDGEKFSTSRGHLIWSADLLAEVPRDLVRFYLALTAPEYQRSNFSVDAMRAVTIRRLVDPWNRLADALSLALVEAGPVVGAAAPLPTTAAGRRRAAVMAERFRLCYDLPTFSMNRAAETILSQLGRLSDERGRPTLRETSAGTPTHNNNNNGGGGSGPGDLLLETRMLLAWAAPILIDVADRAAAAGVALDIGAEPPEAVPAFLLPRLPRAEGAPSEHSAEGAPGEHSIDAASDSRTKARMGVVP